MSIQRTRLQKKNNKKNKPTTTTKNNNNKSMKFITLTSFNSIPTSIQID